MTSSHLAAVMPFLHACRHWRKGKHAKEVELLPAEISVISEI
jgi:hypothetical protein